MPFNLKITTLLFRHRTEELSDNQLIARYKSNGDRELVGILFKRYTRFVFAVCMKYLRNREESEDAVMGIFEKLLEDLSRHRVENFKSWLYAVTKNHCLHSLRNAKKQPLNSNDPVMENAINMYHDNDDGMEERIQQMERELCNLSQEQRVCVELFYLKDRSYHEIATETGYTLNQVKSYIQNGKRNLKNTLTGHEQQEEQLG